MMVTTNYDKRGSHKLPRSFHVFLMKSTYVLRLFFDLAENLFVLVATTMLLCPFLSLFLRIWDNLARAICFKPIVIAVFASCASLTKEEKFACFLLV